MKTSLTIFIVLIIVFHVNIFSQILYTDEEFDTNNILKLLAYNLFLALFGVLCFYKYNNNTILQYILNFLLLLFIIANALLRF